jgi:hypothetical protein
VRNSSIHAETITKPQVAVTQTKADLVTFSPTMAVPRHRVFSSQKTLTRPVEALPGIAGSLTTLGQSSTITRYPELSVTTTSSTDILLRLTDHSQTLSMKPMLSRRTLNTLMPRPTPTLFTRIGHQTIQSTRCGLGPMTSEWVRS